jgi:hypothetical protein
MNFEIYASTSESQFYFIEMGQKIRKKKDASMIHFNGVNCDPCPSNIFGSPNQLTEKVHREKKILEKKPMLQKNLVPDFEPVQDIEKCVIFVASSMLAQT